MSRAVAVVGRCVAWTLTLRPSRTTHSVTLIDALPLQQKHSRKGDNCAASQLEGSPTSHKSLSASTRRPTPLAQRTRLQIHHFRNRLWIRRPDSRTDILSIAGNLVIFSLRMRRNCYIQAFGKNSDNGVRFSNPDFNLLKDSNNSAIRRRF